MFFSHLEKRCAPTQQNKANLVIISCYYAKHACVNKLAVIMACYVQPHVCIIPYMHVISRAFPFIYTCIHAYRIAGRCNAVGTRDGGRGGSTGGPEGLEGEGQVQELPECPEHVPASFLKGKPQSILSLP